MPFQIIFSSFRDAYVNAIGFNTSDGSLMYLNGTGRAILYEYGLI